MNNYAFIDGINLHLTYEYLDWKMDYRKLRIYLRKRHNITTAYYFLGFTEKNKRLYQDLEEYGYEVKYRDVSEYFTKGSICPHCKKIIKSDWIKTKCDCDADITLQMMVDIDNYNKAILISSDGDFNNVVKKLIQLNKLKLIFAPCKDGCSRLLKNASRGRIQYLDKLREELEKIEEEP